MRQFGFLFLHNVPMRGTCLDMQYGTHVFEAVVAFARLRDVRSIQEIRQIGG